MLKNPSVKPRSPIINWNHPQSDRLVLDLNFSENAGIKAFDTAIRRNNFQLSDGTSLGAFGPTRVQTPFGPGLSFDGSNDHLRLADPADGSLDFGLTSFSIEALIKPANFTNAEANIFRKDPGGSPRNLILFRVTQTTGTIRFSVGGSAAPLPGVTGATGMTAGTWNHCVGVRDAETGKITVYLNGNDDGSQTATQEDCDNSGSPAIGGFYDDGLGNLNGAPFTGVMAYVRIYRRALSLQDIRQLYKNPWQIYKRLNPYWTLPATTAATSVKDLIGGFGIIPFAR